MTPDMLVVFGLIGVALALFVLEPIPVDVTAIGLMVALILLEPFTGVTPAEGVSGFSNPATLTVLAMFILSEGVRRTGAIQLLTERLESVTKGSETRTSVALLGIAGPLSGFVNSTPVVAILIPATERLARAADTSPSKLLLPLSFAAMLGSTLTLVGTSSTLLASDISGRLLDRPFSMFEFVHLGAVVLVVGLAYLFTVGRYLTPARVSGEDLTDAFGMAQYLTDVVVLEESPAIGQRVREFAGDRDFDVVRIVRDDEVVTRSIPAERIRDGDVLAIRADRESVLELLEERDLALLPEVAEETDARPAVSDGSAVAGSGDTGLADGDEGDDERDDERAETDLVEVVILPGSSITGRTLQRSGLAQEEGVTVLAIRRGSRVVHARMNEMTLREGDTLLVQGPVESVDRLRANRELVVSGEDLRTEYDYRKIPISVGLLVGAVALAGLGLLPIVVSAFAAAVGMLVTNCLRPEEAYEAVNWSVIFLLAGVIPLGTAMEHTGASTFLANGVVASADLLPVLGVLGVVYLVTAVLTNVVSNTASVVLMVPISIDVAQQLGANPFAFVLGVTFAAATALLSPVGYQTNLMVYGPGGYTFTDFARVGAPLQAVLAVVVTAGIAVFWGV